MSHSEFHPTARYPPSNSFLPTNSTLPLPHATSSSLSTSSDEKGDLESDEPPGGEGGGQAPGRVLTTWKLMFVAFFLTCGGPYGIEDLVGSAGPALTFLGLLILPFIYALPQALMTAELSSMMDENGGYVVWVNRAFGKYPFGEFMGFVNAWICMMDDIIDNSLYVSLFVSYVNDTWPATVPYVWLLNITIIVLVVLMNIWGLDTVSWVSLLILALILSPIIVELGYNADKIHPKEQWFKTSPQPDMNTFLSTLLWLYGGWDSLGTMAGDVQNPQSTYIRGVTAALLMNTCIYILPIVMGLTVSTNLSDWTEGFFVTVAEAIKPQLKYWVLVGSIVSNFGTYNAGLAASSRAMWAMGRSSPKQLPGIFGYTWEKRGTPIVAILISGIINVGFLVFDFEVLVACDTFLDCITLLMEFAAFLWLRYSEPDTPRPFIVPGGIWGAWAITFPKVVVIGTALYFTTPEVAKVSFSIVGGIVIVYFLRKLLFYVMDTMDKRRSHPVPSASSASAYYVPYEALPQHLQVYSKDLPAPPPEVRPW